LSPKSLLIELSRGYFKVLIVAGVTSLLCSLLNRESGMLSIAFTGALCPPD
jgi:hypothetical protein